MMQSETDRKEEAMDLKNSYAQAYKQVVALLDRLPEAERRKIPDEKYEFYKKNMDVFFEWEYDDTLPLEKQNLLEKTNAVMVAIFRNYFATPKQKEQLEAILERNSKLLKKQWYETMIKKEQNTD